MVKGFLITIVLVFLLIFLVLYLSQDKLIYFPRGYATYSRLFDEVEKVSYTTSAGKQVAFLYPPSSADSQNTPKEVWWMFGGNGSTALDWLALLARTELPKGTICVLVDYPGYGLCRGKPKPETIFQSVDVLFADLAGRWSLSSKDLAKRSGAMGHSLGAAVAMGFARNYQFPKVVAISPFTSMKDMARRQVGKLGFLLRHHFDNRESVRGLIEQQPPASITMFHGTRDSLVPFSMGKELANLAGPERCEFHPVENRGHNDILSSIEKELAGLLEGQTSIP